MHRCIGCTIEDAATTLALDITTVAAWESCAWWAGTCAEAGAEVDGLVRKASERAMAESAGAVAETLYESRHQREHGSPRVLRFQTNRKLTVQQYKDVLAGRIPQGLVRRTDEGVA